MKNKWLLVTAGGTAAAVGALAATFATPVSLALLLVLAATSAQIVFLRTVTHQAVPFPALAIIGLNLVGVAGYLYYPTIASQAEVSATLPETSLVYGSAAVTFTTASLSLMIGGLVSGIGSQQVGVSVRDAATQTAALLDRVKSGRLLLAAVIPLVTVAWSYGVNGLFDRSAYGATTGPSLVSRANNIFLPVGIALVSLVFIRSKGTESRVAAWATLLTYVVVTFSTGSRILAMFPSMILLAWLLRAERRGRMRTMFGIAAGAAGSVILLQLPLTMRVLSSGAGLRPYMSLLTADPSLLLRVDLAKLSGNVLFSVPLTGVTATQPPFPTSWLATSVSPLFGGMTNWPTVAEHLRLNVNTPTNGLGELANFGISYLVAYMFVAGLVLGLAQRSIARLQWWVAPLSIVLGLGLTGMFTSSILQYNLRSGTRLLWYMLAEVVVLPALFSRRLLNRAH